MITLVQSPVSSDPEVMGGTLVFRNTRVSVQSLFDYLDDGFSRLGVFGQFPICHSKRCGQFSETCS